MASMKLMGPKGRIKKGKLQKDWAAIDSAAMEGLQVNPWDAGLLADLGDAAKQLGSHRERVTPLECRRIYARHLL